MDALVHAPGADESRAALAAFEKLESVTAQHLDHEEAELEEVYLRNRDTPEIKAMGRAFGKVGPREGGQFFAWLQDGATPDERSAMSQDIPKPVLTIIGGVFGRSYRKNVAPVWRS
ncbi:MAG: hypothetical protein QOK15_3163, partial [Nocardioidaceae bacterium]|nr:hypothetical protein [Nocardioidaceae bacterium]